MSLKHIGFIMLTGLVAIGGAAPASALGEDYIGLIALVGFKFCPRGTAAAAGQIMAIARNQALFSLLGTIYGGDGRTTFALPDLRGTAPIDGMRYCIALEGIFPSRN